MVLMNEYTPEALQRRKTVGHTRAENAGLDHKTGKQPITGWRRLLLTMDESHP